MTPIATPEIPRLWEGEREAEALEGIGLSLFRIGAFQGNRILGKRVITLVCGRSTYVPAARKPKPPARVT